MGIFFFLSLFLQLIAATCSSSVTSQLQPMKYGEGKHSIIKHGYIQLAGVTEYMKSYSLRSDEGQMLSKFTTASSGFLKKDIGSSSNGGTHAANCLGCADTISRKDVIAAVNSRLHRKQVQLHKKINEGASDSAEVTSMLATENTTTIIGQNATDHTPVPLPIIAHIKNALLIIASAGGRHPGRRPVMQKKEIGNRPAKVSLGAALINMHQLLPLATTAASGHTVHAREIRPDHGVSERRVPLNIAVATDHGVRRALESPDQDIRSHVPLNVVASTSAVASPLGVPHAHNIGNGGDHVGEAKQYWNDGPISAKWNVKYTRRAHGRLMEVQEEALEERNAHIAPSSSYKSPNPAASSHVDNHDKARAFHVDYSGPRTHPPRNN